MGNTENKGTLYAAGLLFLALLTAVDQATKYLAGLFLKGSRGIPVIPGVFELFYLENRGAAFGLLRNHQWLFVLVALLMFAAAIYVYALLPGGRHYYGMRVCMILVGAGALGNMIDRIVHHYVIDFLYVSLIDFPVFNVADCYVVIGAVLLLVLVFTLYRDEDFSSLRPW